MWVVAGVAGFILLFAIHLALISRANTITWDEPDHIYSGYMSWHGDFGLNPEHPPLVKFVATAPLLPMRLNLPELRDRPYRLQAVLGGRDFIFHNDADKIVFRAQMRASIFTLLLLVIAFLATQEMFGTTAGFLALGLLLFDPTLLAHGALVTTDAAQACFLRTWASRCYFFSSRDEAIGPRSKLRAHVPLSPTGSFHKGVRRVGTMITSSSPDLRHSMPRP